MKGGEKQMNTINIMQMSSKQTAQSKLEPLSESFDRKGSFLQMLNSSLTQKDTEVTPIAMIDAENEELASLNKLISTFLEELPHSETLMDKEALTIPFIEEFINELPFELQLDIERLFENNETLLEIVGKGEGYLQNPVEILAVMLHLAQVDTAQIEQQAKQDTALVEQKLTQAALLLQRQLEKVVPLLSILKQVNHETFNEEETLLRSSTLKTPLNQQETNNVKEVLVNDAKQVIHRLTATVVMMTMQQKEKLTAYFQRYNEMTNIKQKEQIIFSAHSRATAEQQPITTQGITLPMVQQPLSQLQQFVLHVGENRGDQQTAEQFLRQFQNILGRSSLAQFPNGINQLTIKLFPEHLGRLDVKLTQQNGMIVAQLLTTTQAAKKAIDSQLQQLRQAFIAQNIQVEKIEISTQQQQPSLNQSDKQNQEEKSNNQQNNKRQQEQDSGDEEQSFQDFLDETINIEA